MESPDGEARKLMIMMRDEIWNTEVEGISFEQQEAIDQLHDTADSLLNAHTQLLEAGVDTAKLRATMDALYDAYYSLANPS